MKVGIYRGPHWPITGPMSSRSGGIELFDEMKRTGCDYTRIVSTSGQAYGPEWDPQPYHRRAGKFALGSINPAWLDRLEQMVADAKSRGATVQLAVLEGAHTRLWKFEPPDPDLDPWQPIGLYLDYYNQDGKIRDRGAYYRSRFVRDHQKRLIRAVLGRLGRFDNIIWEVINEGQKSLGAPYQDWLAEMLREFPRDRVVIPRDGPDHRDLPSHKIPGDGGLSDERCITLYRGLVARPSSEFVVADDDCCAKTGARPDNPEIHGQATAVAAVAGVDVACWMYFYRSREGLNSRMKRSLLRTGAVPNFIDQSGFSYDEAVPAPDAEAISGGPYWVLRSGDRDLVFALRSGRCRIPGAKRARVLDPATGEITNVRAEGDAVEFKPSRSLAVVDRELNTEPCEPGEFALCLGGLDLSLGWKVPSKSEEGKGHALEWTRSTAGFWLFSDEQPEVIVTVYVQPEYISVVISDQTGDNVTWELKARYTKTGEEKLYRAATKDWKAFRR